MNTPFARVLRAAEHNQLAIREGASLVRKVIEKTNAPAGFTIHELYNLALKQRPSPDFAPPTPEPKLPVPKGTKQKTEVPAPPHPEHPVRSMAFMKRHILPFLECSQEIQKVRTERTAAPIAPKKGKQAQTDTPLATQTVWVWKHIPPSMRPRPTVPEPPKPVYGADVGVGEDLSHLSKRRERNRRRKIRADVHAMKVAEGIAKQRARSLAGAALRAQQAEQAARKAGKEASVTSEP
ncbi:hypothetical protein H0H81_000064 [Sphagnurus paluster]|uniref:Uncharacterized protein n=1 Tax=Sphagnurus paluster TaxID=117069 RepID=A0A9P7GU57_9AGAR|nr:hypothetical protein H0H81_000064 [Sphagnurus paluster]